MMRWGSSNSQRGDCPPDVCHCRSKNVWSTFQKPNVSIYATSERIWKCYHCGTIKSHCELFPLCLQAEDALAKSYICSMIYFFSVVLCLSSPIRVFYGPESDNKASINQSINQSIIILSTLLLLPTHKTNVCVWCSCILLSGLASFLWFVGFCFLANQWQATTPEELPLAQGSDAARATIAFCFFSILTWVSI